MKTYKVICEIAFMSLAFAGHDLLAQSGFLKDVWAGYEGWVGEPDTVSIRIIPPCSHADSVAIKNSIDTWNGMNTDPKFKLTNSTDAPITIKKDDNLHENTGDVGLTKHKFANQNQNLNTKHERTGADITYDSNEPGISVQEIITHELGHCLGLADVSDPGAVMREIPYEGCSAIPNRQDSLEAEGAFTQSASAYDLEDAVMPDHAILPGTVEQLVFAVEDYIPPGSYAGALCLVWTVDPDVYIEQILLDSLTQTLQVTVFVMPDHPNSQLNLMINIFLPDEDEQINIMGLHFISMNPVPHVVFDCPMNIYTQDGLVYIDWVDYSTYPFPDSLRSFLMVDSESDHYCIQTHPNDDYVLELEPGEYTFTLFVDDYQVNSAVSSQDFVLTGIDIIDNDTGIKIIPNPFTDKCTITLEQMGRIILTDSRGIIIFNSVGESATWEPGPDIKAGLYLLMVERNGMIKVERLIYLR